MMIRALTVVAALSTAVGCQHDCTQSSGPWNRPVRYSSAVPYEDERPADAVEPSTDPAPVYPDAPDLKRPPLPGGEKDVPPQPPRIDVKAEDVTSP